MKMVFYVAAAYMLAVGISGYISNSATASPTADSFASLPSIGSFLGANQPTTEAGINIASAGALAALAYLNVV
jgi:hypothetical protein